MKVLIFSDTHLGKNFDPDLYRYLKNIINSVDKVIINGDLWDSHTISFAEFLASDWKQLFPLLKSKHSIYIHGNHDRLELITEEYKQFADKLVASYEFKVAEQKFYIEHGDRHHTSKAMLLDDIFMPWWLIKLNQIKDWFEVKLFKGRVPFMSNPNHKILSQIRQHVDNTTTIITSHSHYYEESEALNYYNPGFIRFGVASYLIIENGKIQLVNNKY